MENLKNFVFTLNHYVDEHVQYLQSLDCQYIVFGFETAPTTGTPHLQGYIQLRRRRKFGAVAKLLPWHIEPARGTPEQAIEYCKKCSNYFENGQATKNGSECQRDRWKLALQLARDGDWDQLQDVDPCAYIHSYRNLRQIHTDHLDPQDVVRSCIWIFGSAGSGKTRYFRSKFPANSAYWKLANKWFDGYSPNKHEAIILDDLQKCHSVLGPHLLRWADRYPVYGEIKGGMVALSHKYFCVTSNYHPKDIFEDPAILAGIERRFNISEIIENQLTIELMEENNI